MLRPIPKRMLPNTVNYKAYIPDTGEGASYGNDTSLKYVKMEERKQLRQTANGNEVVGNAMMFYDVVNSTGLTGVPAPHSKIIYGSKTYYIVDTDVLRGNNDNPHHYEILLK